MLAKPFARNIIIDILYNLIKYVQYKDVWKLFEMFCVHQQIINSLYIA